MDQILSTNQPQPIDYDAMTPAEIAQDNAEWKRWMDTETVEDRHPETYDAE